MLHNHTAAVETTSEAPRSDWPEGCVFEVVKEQADEGRIFFPYIEPAWLSMMYVGPQLLSVVLFGAPVAIAAYLGEDPQAVCERVFRFWLFVVVFLLGYLEILICCLISYRWRPLNPVSDRPPRIRCLGVRYQLRALMLHTPLDPQQEWAPIMHPTAQRVCQLLPLAITSLWVFVTEVGLRVPLALVALGHLLVVLIPFAAGALFPCGYRLDKGVLTIVKYFPFRIAVKSVRTVNTRNTVLTCDLAALKVEIGTPGSEGFGQLSLHGLSRPRRFVRQLVSKT